MFKSIFQQIQTGQYSVFRRGWINKKVKQNRFREMRASILRFYTLCWSLSKSFIYFILLFFLYFHIIYFLIILFFNFTILYWFCQISTWICHRYTRVPHPEPSSLLPPCTIPLGRPSAPAPSIQYRASNLDWRLVSYILYMFQCHSHKSSHPLPQVQKTVLYISVSFAVSYTGLLLPSF